MWIISNLNLILKFVNRWDLAQLSDLDKLINRKLIIKLNYM